MLVGGVAMVKLVLNEAGERAEFLDVASEKSKIVHLAQDSSHLPLARKNGEKGFAGHAGVLERAVDESQSSPDDVTQFWTEIELSDLSVVKSANESIGILGKGLARLVIQLAVAGDEPVEFFNLRAQQPKESRFLRNDVHSLDGGLGDQMDIARVAEVLAHEGLHTMQNVALRKIEAGGDPSLQLEGQRIQRTSDQIVHFGPNAQEEIVALLERPAFRIPEEPLLDQFGGSVQALFEVTDPDQIMIVAQSAGAILHVGFLHEDAPSVLFAGLRLIGQAPRNVFAFPPTHAVCFKLLPELVEELAVAAQIARLEQRSLGHQIGIGLLDSLGNRTRRMADLVADVPEGRESFSDHFLAGLGRLGLRRRKHDIDVAERR